jgi:cysteine desulfurase/selenocysteine lyase
MSDIWESIRNDFPILNRRFNGNRLIYLDNAATTQIPEYVLDGLMEFYKNSNANVHRGVYALSEEATDRYEKARETVRSFIGANRPEEILFVRGSTEGLNLIASSLGKYLFNGKKGGIITTIMEHHSNIVPWQFLQESGAELIFADIHDDGTLDYSFLDMIDENTKIVTVTGTSNVLGVIPDIKKIARKVHDAGAYLVVDGAQLVPHKEVNVNDLECDFLVFSGHKMVAPTGIGVVWGKYDLLEKIPPYMGGGDMIKEVHKYNATWNDLPQKFEAGTTNIAGAIALEKAIQYLKKIGMNKIEEREHTLTKMGMEIFDRMKNVTLYGPHENRASLFSFNIGRAHAHDVASIFDSMGIAIRAGHHCAQPLMERYNVTAMARASLYFYNSEEDVAMIEKGIEKVKQVFRT